MMYAELAQDIWPHATPEQIAVLSNALRKGFVRSASPSTTSPAQSSTNVHPSNNAASGLSVAFKQHFDSIG